MSNCNCDHCGCDEEKEEVCECDETCDENCRCDHEHASTEEKATALKESISKAVSELGYAVEETEEGIKISE